MRSHPDFPRIARALARVPARAWSGLAYRSVSPAYAGARDVLSGEGVRRYGGRWNAAGSFAAVYASLTPETSVLWAPPSAAAPPAIPPLVFNCVTSGASRLPSV